MTEPKDSAKSIKLVIFDVEGVLLRVRVPSPFAGGGYILYEAVRRKGLISFIQFLFLGLFYTLRLISTETAASRGIKLLKGLDRQVFQEIFDGLIPSPGLIETFDELRKSGIHIALVSYGIPSFLLDSLKRRIGAQYAYGVELEMEDGKATGEIGGIMSRKNGKVLALNEICRREGISPEECAVVADDRGNCSLFQASGLSVGLSPDRDLGRCADVNLESQNLSDVLPHILAPSSAPSAGRSFTLHDFSRLLFHISGLWVPYLGLFLGVRPLLFLIGLTTLTYCVSEFLRLQGRDLPAITSITTFPARTRELRQFILAPVYFALGILIVLLFFPNSLGFAGIAVLTLGDSTASFVGSWIGRTKLSYNRLKSLEGTLAGILMGMLGGALFVDFRLAIIGSSIGMFVESLPLPFDDNFTVPISAATAMFIMSLIL